MQSFKKFSDKQEAMIVQQMLKSNGIEAEVYGAKEYGAHVTGIDYGVYELRVSPEQVDAAEKLLAESKKLSEAESVVIRPAFYLKRAVMYSMFAMFMLPIVFNYYSLKNLFLYLKYENNLFIKTWIGIGVLLLQIPTVVLSYLILRHLNS